RRPDGPGREVAGQVPRGRVRVVRRLDQVRQDKASGQLTPDLLSQRVAVLDRAVSVRLRSLGGGEVERAERDRVPDHELLPLVQGRHVEDEYVRVHEPGQQSAGRAQHAEALPPDRGEVGAEHVRHRIEYDVKAGIGEDSEIAHVAEHGEDRQALPGGHLFVATELPGRVVENGYGCARRRQHWPLLSPAGGKTEHLGTGQLGGEPVTRRWLVTDEHHGPVSGPRPCDDIGPDRPRPLIVVVHLAVPRGTVVRYWIEVFLHSSAA